MLPMVAIIIMICQNGAVSIMMKMSCNYTRIKHDDDNDDDDHDHDDDDDDDDNNLCVQQNRRAHKESRFHIPRSFPSQRWRKF